MSFIPFVNSISLGMTISILAMHYETYSAKRLGLTFLLCAGTDIFFNLYIWQFRSWSIYFLIPCLAFSMHHSGQKLGQCFLNALIVILVTALQTYTFGCVFIWLSYQRFATEDILYNVIFCIMNIVCAVVFSQYHQGELLDVSLKTKKGILSANIFCGFYIVFLTRLLPLLPMSNDAISYSVVIMTFVVFTVCLYVAIKKISSLEMAASTIKLKQEYAAKDQEEQQKIRELKHYFLRLYRFYIEMAEHQEQHEIKKYFEMIYEDIYGENKNLKCIQFINNDMIQHLFLQLYHDVSQLPHVKLTMEVSGCIVISDIKEMDLFQILSIFLDNALEAVKEQTNGFIEVMIIGEADCSVFKISNSYDKNADKKSFGMGLRLLEKIISRYSNIDFETRILTEIYIQTIAIRREVY